MPVARQRVLNLGVVYRTAQTWSGAAGAHTLETDAARAGPPRFADTAARGGVLGCGVVRVAGGEVTGRVRGLQVLQLALAASGAVHALHAVLAERAGVEPGVARAGAAGEGRAVHVAGHVAGKLAGAADEARFARVACVSVGGATADDCALLPVGKRALCAVGTGGAHALGFFRRAL